MMEQEKIDHIYMRRCIQIATNGLQNTKPNPMVGAVIVAKGRIIGEGYHVRYGEGHAEVNAFASVRPEDEPLLSQSTLYVSLEPCSHYGKTPPCADLIVSKGVYRVVVGCVDPFSDVSGRGIRRIQDAGIEVTVGVLEKECLELNKRFITFHTHHRPYIILKWAQSTDGFIDDHFRPARFSTPFTQMLSHKLRAENDAILVGRVTDEREHSRLDVRHWYGQNPLRLVLNHTTSLPQLMRDLYEQKIQSLIVEGGAKTHQSFLAAGLWDEIRVETAPCTVGSGTVAPQLSPNLAIESEQMYDGNSIVVYRRR